MSINEVKFRIEYFCYVFGVWLKGRLTCRPPKGMKLEKQLISYGIVVGEEEIEHHQGTITEFIKWIITREPIGIV